MRWQCRPEGEPTPEKPAKERRQSHPKIPLPVGPARQGKKPPRMRVVPGKKGCERTCSGDPSQRFPVHRIDPREEPGRSPSMGPDEPVAAEAQRPLQIALGRSPQGEGGAERKAWKKGAWKAGGVDGVNGHVVSRSYLTGRFTHLRSRLGDG